jgi:hypothetical protein
MERGDKIRRGQTYGRYSVKARIPILPFLFLTLIFSCKSAPQSVPPVVVPEIDTQISQDSEPEKITEAVDTSGIVEEAAPTPGIDIEDGISELPYEEEGGEALEETLEEILIEAELAAEPEIPVIEEVPEAPIQEDVQEDPVQTEEESVPLPEPEPAPPSAPPPVQPPVEQPPPVPPVEPPPVQSQPVQPPAPQIVPQPPAQQSQVPERTAPREPPPPPPFLGPAEPERIPPERQEIFTPPEPELPSLPRDETPEEQIVFSRVVRITVGQMLEIPFRGTGWVYLGELGNRRGISYDSRRLDIENGITLGQSFVFRAEAAGTYILKFYKQDFIQDYIINDYVQVIVGEADDSGTGRPFSMIDRGRVIAEPRWPFIAEAAGSTSEAASSPAQAAAGTAAETPPQRPDDAAVSAAPSAASASPAPEVILPEEYVRRARQEFDAGRVEQALAILESMKQRYPSGTDEAWWLSGQLYEANSPARDIRLSLEYYRRLVNEYPQSNRVDDARRRIAYLERYYFNIR